MEANTKTREMPKDLMLSVVMLITAVSIFLPRMIVKTLIIPSELDIEGISHYARGIHEFFNDSHEFKGFALYIVLLCVFAVLLTLGFRALYNRLSPKALEMTEKRSRVAAPILFAASGFVVVNKFISLIYFGEGFYTNQTSFKVNLKTAMTALSIVCILWILYELFKKKKLFGKCATVSSIVIDALVVIVILYLSSFFILTNLDVNVAPFHLAHFAAVFNPIYEIQNGKALGVDLPALYGFYGYFFRAVEMFFFGKVTVGATVTLMGMLIAVSGIAIYIVLRKIVKNRLVAVFSALGIIFASQLTNFIYNNQPYYQYNPIRLIFPSLTLLFITLRHTVKSSGGSDGSVGRKKKRYFALAAITAAVSLYWNPESGIIAIMTLIAYSAYEAAEKHYINSLDFWKTLGKRAAVIFAATALATYVLEVFTFIRSGQFLSAEDLFWGIKIFAGDGFFMLPLPEEHPYVIVLFIYSLAVIAAITKLKLFRKKTKEQNAEEIAVKESEVAVISEAAAEEIENTAISEITAEEIEISAKEDENTDSAYSDYPLLFTLGVLGFGAFSYFLGRSHHYNFLMGIYPVFLIAAYFFNKFAGFWKAKKNGFSNITKIVSVGAAVCIFTVVFFTGFSVFTLKEHPAWQYYTEMRKAGDTMVTRGGAEYVYAYRMEHMAVVDMHASFIMSHNGLKNEYDGSAVIDYFFKEDYAHLLEFARNYQGRLFISQEVAAQAVPLEGGLFNELLAQVLEERYYLVAADYGLYVYDSTGN